MKTKQQRIIEALKAEIEAVKHKRGLSEQRSDWQSYNVWEHRLDGLKDAIRIVKEVK